MLTRLANRGTLALDSQALEQLKVNLERRSQLWAKQGSLVASTAIILAFLGSSGFTKIPLMILEGLGGYIAGRYLGRMASYGTLSQVLRQNEWHLRLQPGHIDKVGGIKPLGDFYFWQAMVTAIPAAFLAIWWVIIPLLPRYQSWRQSYLGLLAVAIFFELLAFIIPLWLFHLDMEAEKLRLIKKADEYSYIISELRSQLLEVTSKTQEEQLQQSLSKLSQRYWDIEQMPTWPIDASIRRRFTLNNLALFLPLIGQLVGNSQIWNSLEKIIDGLVSNQ